MPEKDKGRGWGTNTADRGQWCGVGGGDGITADAFYDRGNKF